MEVTNTNDDYKTVNKPDHYAAGCQIECIEALYMTLSEEEFRGFLLGNALKYLWRHGSKIYPGKTAAESAEIDIDKAQKYFAFLRDFNVHSTKKSGRIETVVSLYSDEIAARRILDVLAEPTESAEE